MSSLATPTSQSVAGKSSPRLIYLDWLRVVAIGFVFLFHAVHAFDQGDWQVKNVQQSEILTILLLFFGLWGMSFFFLLSGAGSWFALQRRSRGQYIAERFNRLLIPFVVGTILFSPIEYAAENLNKIQRGVISQRQDFFSSFRQFDPRLLRFPGWSPRWFGSGFHLWFLGFLFSFAVITLPLFLWLKGQRGTRLRSRLAAFCEHRGGLLLLVLPAAIINSLLLPIFPLEHDWADFISHMYFFALGFVLFSDERFARAIRRDWALLLGLGTVVTAVLTAALLADVPVLDWAETPGIPQFYIIQLLRWTIALCFSVAMLGIGMRYWDRSTRWLRPLLEASMPFFVLHQPVIIVIAFAVVQWSWGLWPKLLLVVVSSFLVTAVLVRWVVLKVPFLQAVFGVK
jgi:glucans biosynthesis protein C